MTNFYPLDRNGIALIKALGQNDIKEAQRILRERFHAKKDKDILSIFIECLETAMNSRYRYQTRRTHLENAICLYGLFNFIQEDWVFDEKAIRYTDKFYPRKWEAPKLLPFDDGINYDAPEEEGLYFIGEVNANPHTFDFYYWVKIGYSSMLKDRMANYNTACPMLWRIDFNTSFGEDSRSAERVYHRMLNKVGIAACNHSEEWFLVSRETYLEMCEKGFSYFD